MNSIIKTIIFLIIITIILITFLYLVLRARHYILMDKKFNKYSIKSNNSKSTSLFDNLFVIINKLINSISKMLNHSQVLTDYSKRYEKHISYDELDKRNCIDYVSIKVLLGLLISILFIITSIFNFKDIGFIGLLFSFLIGFFMLDVYLTIIYNKKRKEISDDLLKAIIMMNNSFKSGMSIMQAIEIVKNELDGAIGDEFKKIYLDLSYGLTIEVVFNRFYKRVNLEEAKFISTSLTLLNKTGGNIIKVFKSIEKEFFDRKKLNDELKTTTAASNFVYKVLLFIPFIISLFIYVLNPSYFNPLFNNTLGLVILSLIVVLYILYIIVIKKVMRVNI